MKENITPSFGGIIPENYDRYLGTLFFESCAIDLVERIKHLNPALILELAGGTGRVTRHLAENFPASKIYATDLNPDMLNVGKKNVLENNVEWKTADMQAIPFEDNYFDLIVCQFGIMFVPDKQKAFMEMCRVLKPGGFLIINSWDKLEFNNVALTAHETVNTFFKDNPVMFYYIPFSYNDEKEIKNNFENAGFTDVKVSLTKYEGYNDSIEDSTTGLIEGNPVLNSINERDPTLLPQIKRALRDALAKKFGEINPRFPLQALVSTGIKK